MSGYDPDVQYIEFYVDSADFKYGSRDNPRLYFPETITDVIGFRLLSVEVPFSYDVVNAQYNTFTSTDSSGTGTCTIATGTYSASTIAAAVATALNARASPPGASYTVTTVVGADSNYQLKISLVKTASAAAPTLKFNTSTGVATAADVMGFAVDTLYTFSEVGLNWELTSPGKVNLTGPNYLYLNSNLASLLYGSVYASYGGSGHSIGRITIDVNPGQVAYFNNSSQNFFSCNPTNLNYLEFYIAFPKTPTTPVALNNFAFTLRFGILRRRNNAGSDRYAAR